MKYYMVNTAPTEDMSYCFVNRAPEGVDSISYRMAEGYEMGEEYPQDPRIYLQDSYPGIKIPSLMGNTEGYLLVSSALKEIIVRHNCGKLEVLPVSIYNHKKRLHAKDFFIINPIGAFDCLNMGKSEIEWHKGSIVGIDKYVLEAKKLANAPDLFRVKEDPYKYVASQKLLSAMKEAKPTNVFVTELDVA